MAWFSNLAEKAEDMLNKLDQNASIILLQNGTKVCDNVDDNLFLANLNKDVWLPSESEKIQMINNTWKEFASSSDNSIRENDTSDDNLEIQSEIDESRKSSSIQEIHQIDELINNEHEPSFDEIAELKNIIINLESKNSFLKFQLRQAITSLNLAQEDIEKHKNKTQKVLEDKERLLIQLENYPVSSNTNEYIEHVSKLMKTTDDLQKTVDDLTERLELMQIDLGTTQKQCSLYQEEAVAARQSLQKEEKNRITLEDELKQNKHEFQKVYNELRNTMVLLDSRNEKINELQKQIDLKSLSENEELESKYHMLTKALLMKQSSLETITTERNALRLQLEKAENNYTRALSEMTHKNTCLNIGNSSDEGRTSSFLTMSPFDQGVTRNVKRAISTINTFSIRLGVFLRRYPIARVFLLCYIVLLHIWVVVILFAYLPK